ncbi:CoA ester lyase [Prescottella equi]|uniref:HpcH/HpaI aldolase/citrate lyase family protein n=1 Tax=Rhodococcus hoagii TaxID=43767 RepID=UPI00301BC033
MSPRTSSKPRQFPAALARSWLLVSAADKPAVDRADASNADAIVLDLEDGVAAIDKASARDHANHCLHGTSGMWVRINNATTDDWVRDLDMIASSPTPAGVVLAKAEDAEQVTATAARLAGRSPVVAMIESALGLENARAIAEASPTARLAFGSGDFRLDTGMGADPIALAHTRSLLVIASRTAQISAPIDGPCLTDDVEELSRSIDVSKSAGMSGKLCLSIAQIDQINRAFAPTPSEIEWAQNLIERLGADGARVRRGSERPQLARALRIRDHANSFAAASRTSTDNNAARE